MCLLIRYDSNSAGEINIDMYIETEIRLERKRGWALFFASINNGKINQKLILTKISHTLGMFCDPVGSSQYHLISLRQIVIPVILLCFRQGRLHNWVIFPSYHHPKKIVWKLGACARAYTDYVVYMKAGAISIHIKHYTVSPFNFLALFVR